MSTDLELRVIEPEELADWVRTFSVAFGQTYREDQLPGFREFLELDRTIAAFDRGRPVSTGGILSFELTLPGLTTIPAGGVTAIAVLPTHTRRGILTAMMRRQLEDMRERGEAVGLLFASESNIYGRYGYGLASTTCELKVESRYGTFRALPQPAGSVRLVQCEEAAKLFPGIYDAARRQRPGQINRPDHWWSHWFKDEPDERRGMSERFYVLHEGDGGADGYLAYRISPSWSSGLPGNTMRIQELITASSDAYTALWRYALTMDLVPTVYVWGRPVDEPLRWMLAESRRLRFESVNDGLWARLVDIPAALSARRYLSQGALTLAVTDPFCPENDGTYRLEGGPDGAECRKTDAEPDLALKVDDLAAVYLGGVRFGTLQRAGRVEERRSGALTRAEALFASEVEPWCSHGF